MPIDTVEDYLTTVSRIESRTGPAVSASAVADALDYHASEGCTRRVEQTLGHPVVDPHDLPESVARRVRLPTDSIAADDGLEAGDV